jgi:hypothetical protein
MIVNILIRGQTCQRRERGILSGSLRKGCFSEAEGIRVELKDGYVEICGVDFVEFGKLVDL